MLFPWFLKAFFTSNVSETEKSDLISCVLVFVAFFSFSDEPKIEGLRDTLHLMKQGCLKSQIKGPSRVLPLNHFPGLSAEPVPRLHIILKEYALRSEFPIYGLSPSPADCY